MLACSECTVVYANSKVKRCGRCSALVCQRCLDGSVHVCQPGRIIRIVDLVAEKTSVEWLVDGLLPNVGWTLFHGVQGYGKTTFALQMCEALQLGKTFMGRETKQTDVLYVNADSPVKEWQAMCARIAPECEGWTLVDAPERALGNPRYVEAINTLKRRVKPGFIVFDSLYNLCSSPARINTGDILLDINQMKAIASGVPWLLIHHPAKESNRASGHNSLEGNCSNEWSMLQTKLAIQKGRLVADKELLLVRSNETGMWSMKPERALSATVQGDRQSRTEGYNFMNHRLT